MTGHCIKYFDNSQHGYIPKCFSTSCRRHFFAYMYSGLARGQLTACTEAADSILPKHVAGGMKQHATVDSRRQLV